MQELPEGWKWDSKEIIARGRYIAVGFDPDTNAIFVTGFRFAPVSVIIAVLKRANVY